MKTKLSLYQFNLQKHIYTYNLDGDRFIYLILFTVFGIMNIVRQFAQLTGLPHTKVILKQAGMSLSGHIILLFSNLHYIPASQCKVFLNKYLNNFTISEKKMFVKCMMLYWKFSYLVYCLAKMTDKIFLFFHSFELLFLINGTRLSFFFGKISVLFPLSRTRLVKFSPFFHFLE